MNTYFGLVRADGSILKFPATEGHIAWLLEPNFDYKTVAVQALIDMLHEDLAPGSEATLAAFVMPAVVQHILCDCISGRPHYRVEMKDC